MPLPESWSIKARAHQCAITEVKFIDQQEFYTAIFPDPESSGYLRMDFSLDAWDQRPEELQKPFSFWKNNYEVSVTEEKTEVVTKESAEELLSRLIEEDQEHTENARYILAVMLERKKLLKETDNQETPNGILRIYEHRKNGEIYIVLDPNIPLDQVEHVQKEVSELLDGNDQKQKDKMLAAQEAAENKTKYQQNEESTTSSKPEDSIPEPEAPQPEEE